MKTLLPSLAAVALLALAACNNKEPQVVSSEAPDPQAAALANAAPVELPPSIKADVTFRCNPGNSLAYVTFFNGDKQALVKTDKAGTAVKLTAETAGDPLKAEGYELTGTPKAATLTLPGKGALTCKA